MGHKCTIFKIRLFVETLLAYTTCLKKNITPEIKRLPQEPSKSVNKHVIFQKMDKQALGIEQNG